MTVLGFDIGGANLKASDAGGRAISRPLAIWKHRDQLSGELAAILQAFPTTTQVALTMTAELADCFSSKHEGVCFIIDAVQESLDGAGITTAERLRVWSTEGRFLSPHDARTSPYKVAAANWHALASWCGQQYSNGSALLIDIGSTTTDIIPLACGKPIPVGLTDAGRLQSGELAYSGLRRTPLCAVAHSVPYRDGYCSLAAELFATTLDVYLLLDQIAEDESDHDSADGRPATKSAAHSRLAHMLCCDSQELSFDTATQIARFLADVQRQRLAGCLERVVSRLPGPCETVIIAGSGRSLASQLVLENRRTSSSTLISLAQTLSPEAADAACAYALTQLN